MVKIASIFSAALFGAVAMAMPIGGQDKLAERGVVVVTVYKTAVAVPTIVAHNNNVVVKTVYETVYARPATAVKPVAPVVSVIAPTTAPVVPVVPHKPQTTASSPPPPPPVATPTPTIIPTTPVATPTTPPVQPPSGGDWQNEMLAQVNTVRARAGKKALTLSGPLNSIAQAHSQVMSSTRDMTHADPRGSLGTRYGAAGISWKGAAENIAWNQKTVAQVMNAWTNSPGHYANMVGDYTSVGFGEVNFYWTQNFVKL
ncbi:hypothetical protein GGI20_001008 [Coemansia sp. BCRC 34301]|nr:hypothetical protein GGI20_001008 [Coemansia sp. BCRC 34301]